MANPEIKVLDKGFVRLIDHMGSDLSVVNAARVSFGKRKEAFEEGDAKLIGYLAEHEHTSPFRHTALTLHVKAPIFVFGRWVEHGRGSGFKGIGGGSVEYPEDGYSVPAAFRRQAKVNKQGSEGEIDEANRARAMESYLESCRGAVTHYKELLSLGVCREQARCVLPVGLYSEVYWTVSLQAVAHFIRLRTDSHAQWEIQQYAAAVRSVVEPLYPVGLKALLASGKG